MKNEVKNDTTNIYNYNFINCICGYMHNKVWNDYQNVK